MIMSSFIEEGIQSLLGKGNCRGIYPTTSEFKYAQQRELVIGAAQSLHTELNQVQLCMTDNEQNNVLHIIVVNAQLHL